MENRVVFENDIQCRLVIPEPTDQPTQIIIEFSPQICPENIVQVYRAVTSAVINKIECMDACGGIGEGGPHGRA